MKGAKKGATPPPAVGLLVLVSYIDASFLYFQRPGLTVSSCLLIIFNSSIICIIPGSYERNWVTSWVCCLVAELLANRPLQHFLDPAEQMRMRRKKRKKKRKRMSKQLL